jgi:hypothetical protein
MAPFILHMKCEVFLVIALPHIASYVVHVSHSQNVLLREMVLAPPRITRRPNGSGRPFLVGTGSPGMHSFLFACHWQIVDIGLVWGWRNTVYFSYNGTQCTHTSVVYPRAWSMMSLRFVLNLCSRSCLQNAAYRGCWCGFTCQSHKKKSDLDGGALMAVRQQSVQFADIVVKNTISTSICLTYWLLI